MNYRVIKAPFLSLSSLSLVFAAFCVSADQVINDDLIIKNSLCVGMDCSNGENFNYDTIRMKENNTRIRFIDTSSTSSFPSRDWQLTANDSTNGGINQFSIENVDSGAIPFLIVDGAPINSFYMKDSGDIGFNTNAPIVELHVVDGNSPTLRLEQDSSAGFAAQGWDVSGNETNFFVRDANTGQLPLRIRAGAPAASIYVDIDGDVGFETTSPDGIFDIAHPLSANNHAVLVSSSGDFGINIDNGFNPYGLFDVQSTGGVSRLLLKSTGAVGVNTGTTGAGAITGILDVYAADTTTKRLGLTDSGNLSVMGKIGVNTTDFSDVLGVPPTLKLQALSGLHSAFQFENPDANYTSGFMFTQNNIMKWYISSRNSFSSGGDALYILDSTASTPTMSLFQDKTIGLGGIQQPVANKDIVHFNGAYLSDDGKWMDVSSRDAKENIEQISSAQAFDALGQLEPVLYNYKITPDESHAGFIAEDVPDIVAARDRKSLSSMDVVAVLTKVVKEQQATIEQQQRDAKAQQQLVKSLSERLSLIESNR